MSRFAIDGSGNDLVDVFGTIALDGDLAIELAAGLTPDAADTFLLYDTLGLGGVFNNVLSGERLTTLDGSGSFVVNYGIGSVFDARDVVLSDFEVIPEPGTFAALGAAGLTLLGRRRRSQ